MGSGNLAFGWGNAAHHRMLDGIDGCFHGKACKFPGIARVRLGLFVKMRH
jgi:hypothetical protein